MKESVSLSCCGRFWQISARGDPELKAPAKIAGFALANELQVRAKYGQILCCLTLPFARSCWVLSRQPRSLSSFARHLITLLYTERARVVLIIHYISCIYCASSRASRGRKFQGKKYLISQGKNLPIECAQGHQHSRMESESEKMCCYLIFYPRIRVEAKELDGTWFHKPST